ncbi:MAG: hypothetical protein ACI8RT_000443, partial [Candidatus Azotimanducaceae bacterium]
VFLKLLLIAYCLLLIAYCVEGVKYEQCGWRIFASAPVLAVA